MAAKKVSMNPDPRGRRKVEDAEQWLAAGEPRQEPAAEDAAPDRRKERRVRISVDLPHSVYKRLKLASVEQELSIVSIVTVLIEREFPP